MEGNIAVGIDVGGTGIKSAVVDLVTGGIVGEKRYVATPQPATPQAVAASLRGLMADAPDGVPVGIDIPAVVRGGIVRTAANIDRSWIGCNGAELFAEAIGRPVALLNDADAAGLAEMQYGAGRGRMGSVAVITLGTGIGSALFTDSHLVYNTELGHLEHDGRDCCNWAAAAAMVRESITWDQWLGRLQSFLTCFESLLWPDLFIIGGAISSDSDRFLPLLHTEAEIIPAELRGDAGIVGAAWVGAAGLPATVAAVA